MKKHALIWITVVSLVLAMLPTVSASTVSGSELRAMAVAQAEAIAGVPWTLETRIAKADVTGERLDAFNAGGIFPTTYFEYSRLRFPIRGVMVESNTGTLEQFISMQTPGVNMVEGYGHVPSRVSYVGMDVNAFLTDVIARVSPAPITSLKQALTDDSLDCLMDGVDLSASSSKAAVNGMTLDKASEAYDKLQQGDLLLAWDDNADTAVSPRIHALVVQSANPAKDEVTVIYPSYNLLVWYLECGKCGFKDTFGPSSAALTKHVNSVSYTFDSFKKHLDTYPDSGCDGEWKPIYATSWYTETVSYSSLFDTGVTCGSVGYLPYTLDVYSAPVEPQVTFTTNATAQSLMGGVEGVITSNYRITSVEAKLTNQTGESQTFTSNTGADSWTWDYLDNNLNKALMECAPGNYELSITVFLGTTERDKNAFAPVCVYKQEFAVAENSFQLSCDKTRAEQGEPFTLTLTALEDGFTGVRATLNADTNYYAFDAAASMAASPDATFTQRADGSVIVERYGSAVNADGAVFKMVYTPVRTGNWAVTEGIEPFWISGIQASKQAGASAAQLTTSRAGGNGIVVAVGQNTQVFRDYVKGYDLVLAYMAVNEMRNQDGETELKMSYDGKPMYDVTTSHYNVNGNSWLRIYACITKDADPSKVTKGEEVSPELSYSYDVNQSGSVDISDVQAISNLRNGRMPFEGNEIKWFMADIDRNGVVDAGDQAALIEAMTR